MARLHYVKPVALPIPKALPIHCLSEGVINAPTKQIKKDTKLPQAPFAAFCGGGRRATTTTTTTTSNPSPLRTRA